MRRFVARFIHKTAVYYIKEEKMMPVLIVGNRHHLFCFHFLTFCGFSVFSVL